MMIHIEKLQDKLYEDIILVSRVDPRVSVYERTPPEEYMNGALNVDQN